MFERFGRDAGKVVHDAVEQAAALGSPTIEAEHLLLAIAGGRHGSATVLLDEAGLDADGLLAALEREHELSSPPPASRSATSSCRRDRRDRAASRASPLPPSARWSGR